MACTRVCDADVHFLAALARRERDAPVARRLKVFDGGGISPADGAVVRRRTAGHEGAAAVDLALVVVVAL